MQLEIKKNKVSNPKTLMSKTATIPSNKNKKEDILKKNEAFNNDFDCKLKDILILNKESQVKK